MEEEYVEIEVQDSTLYEDDGIDINYEFDAPRFFDFTQQETFWDACEAEQWFEFAESYPPAPFLLKMKWGNSNTCVDAEQVSAIEENNSKGSIINNDGLKYLDQTTQNTLEGKTKALKKSSSTKSKAFTFMKPTASHLAKKMNLPPQVPTSRGIQKEKSLSIKCLLPKRQKLETGYLRKVARLKHQTLFTNKKTKEVNRKANLISKSNVTIPREPNLQTALRAQRHKSRTDNESCEHPKSSSQVNKTRPLNKKGGGTLNDNLISITKTRTNTSVNKLQDSSRDKQVSSKAKRGVFRSIKVFPLESNDKIFQDEPPTKLLSKLTLISQAKKTTKLISKEKSASKDLKENRLRTLQEYKGMNFVKEEIQRLYENQYRCANQIGSFVTIQTYMLELGH